MCSKGSLAARCLPLLLAGACAPISVSHYQSARPVGQGNHQFGAGFHIPKDGGQGTDVDNNDGDPVETHHGVSLLVNNVDLEYHYGLSDRAELRAQVYPTGAEFGGRFSWLDTPSFRGSVDLALGAFSGGYKTESADGTSKYENNISGTYVDVPMIFSVHASERFAVYGGPRVTRFDSLRKVRETQGGTITDRFTRKSDFFQLGGVLGLCIGKTVQLSPGFAFYLEHSEYPIEDFGGKGVFAYPFLGLTYVTGQTQ